MDYEHPPFIIEKSGRLYVVATGVFWERGKTVYVQKSSTEYYEVVLEQPAPELAREGSSLEFWTFTPISLQELEEPVPVPWEYASHKQQLFIEKLLRTRKYDKTDTGIKAGGEDFEVELERLDLLTKPQAGKLIALLKACKDKAPDYPVFRRKQIEGKKGMTWIIDGVPEGKQPGDKIVAAQRNGELIPLVLVEKHTIGRKTYWEFKDDYSSRNDEEGTYSEAEKYYSYMPDYYLDCEEDRDEWV